MFYWVERLRQFFGRPTDLREGEWIQEDLGGGRWKVTPPNGFPVICRVAPSGTFASLQEVAKPPGKSLGERIESLKFYGTGDEGYELFDQACRFAYSLYGLGDDEWAETVVGWAEEMAAHSYSYAVNNGEDLKDFEKGVWG